jgi:uncharacterized protein (TIGR00369 family)
LIFKLTTDMLICMPAVTLADLPGRPCPIAAALELVGERWALLIVRELALGNSRFDDIVRGTGAPRDRVAARLKALDEAGELPPPPMAALMQFGLVDVEPGKAVLTCQPDGSVYNPNGGVHGGLVCTLLDSAAGLALHSTLPAGKGYTSIEIKVNYLKAVRLDAGPLTATGTVVKSGSRVGFTEGVVTNAAGAVVATATSTLLVFDL